MKRFISFISFFIVMINLISVVAFADAATYDIENVDYYVYVATPDGGLNMRYGPGTEYDKVMAERIPDGVMLHIEMKSGNWGYTSYNGNYGWVALKQTSATPPKSSEVQKEEPVVREPEIESKPETDTKPENESKPETDTKPEFESKPETDTKPEIEIKPETDIKPEFESESNSISESQVDEFNVNRNYGKSPLSSQIMMIAVLILLIIALAIVVIIIININSKK